MNGRRFLANDGMINSFFNYWIFILKSHRLFCCLAVIRSPCLLVFTVAVENRGLEQEFIHFLMSFF